MCERAVVARCGGHNVHAKPVGIMNMRATLMGMTQRTALSQIKTLNRTTRTTALVHESDSRCSVVYSTGADDSPPHEKYTV